MPVHQNARSLDRRLIKEEAASQPLWMAWLPLGSVGVTLSGIEESWRLMLGRLGQRPWRPWGTLSRLRGHVTETLRLWTSKGGRQTAFGVILLRHNACASKCKELGQKINRKEALNQPLWMAWGCLWELWASL